MPDEADNLFEDKRAAWLLAVLFLVAGLVLCFTAAGTGDDGDSIMHYQFAKWAPFHHELFFDHWAKPLYVLIASPFAQFGIPGIKIFNLLLSTFTLFITFSIAGISSIRRKALVVLFMIMSPGLIIHALSGLTEPLFAFVLSLSVLLYLRSKYVFSILLISFLPFVRSEGLIICGVFALLLLFEGKWKLLPLLIAGHLVYGLAGSRIYGSVLWVFTRIPYARLSSIYGHGYWHDFFVRLPLIIGGPMCLLLLFGLIIASLTFYNLRSNVKLRRKLFLVYGSFLSYFVSHVIFWKFGIFNSYGLMRVLIGVLPMMAIIELDGFNALVAIIPSAKARLTMSIAVLLCIIIFPFTSCDSAWHYDRDFGLSTFQKVDAQLTDYIKTNYPDYRNAQYYFDANYFSILLNIDYFDKNTSRHISEATEHPPHRKAFILWDDYYSRVENETPLEVPANNPAFKFVKKFTLTDPWNYDKTVVLFETRNPAEKM
jgi:hypothetical protein